MQEGRSARRVGNPCGHRLEGPAPAVVGEQLVLVCRHEPALSGRQLGGAVVLAAVEPARVLVQPPHGGAHSGDLGGEAVVGHRRVAGLLEHRPPRHGRDRHDASAVVDGHDLGQAYAVEVQQPQRRHDARGAPGPYDLGVAVRAEADDGTPLRPVGDQCRVLVEQQPGQDWQAAVGSGSLHHDPSRAQHVGRLVAEAPADEGGDAGCLGDVVVPLTGADDPLGRLELHREPGGSAGLCLAERQAGGAEVIDQPGQDVHDLLRPAGQLVEPATRRVHPGRDPLAPVGRTLAERIDGLAQTEPDLVQRDRPCLGWAPDILVAGEERLHVARAGAWVGAVLGQDGHRRSEASEVLLVPTPASAVEVDDRGAAVRSDDDLVGGEVGVDHALGPGERLGLADGPACDLRGEGAEARREDRHLSSGGHEGVQVGPTGRSGQPVRSGVVEGGELLARGAPVLARARTGVQDGPVGPRHRQGGPRARPGEHERGAGRTAAQAAVARGGVGHLVRADEGAQEDGRVAVPLQHAHPPARGVVAQGPQRGARALLVAAAESREQALHAPGTAESAQQGQRGVAGQRRDEHVPLGVERQMGLLRHAVACLGHLGRRGVRPRASDAGLGEGHTINLTRQVEGEDGAGAGLPAEPAWLDAARRGQCAREPLLQRGRGEHEVAAAQEGVVDERGGLSAAHGCLPRAGRSPRPGPPRRPRARPRARRPGHRSAPPAGRG